VSPTQEALLTLANPLLLLPIDLLACSDLICCAPVPIRPQCAPRRAAAPALFSKGSGAVMITRFAQVMTQATVLEKAANHVWMRAVNSLRDSLNVALGSGSDAESAMTWRRGEQDLQQPSPCPTAIVRQRNRYRTSLANADLTMAVQLMMCSSHRTRPCRANTEQLTHVFWRIMGGLSTSSWLSMYINVNFRPILGQRSGELRCRRRELAVTSSFAMVHKNTVLPYAVHGP
jgi:hypothetical protein